ncbi:leucine-rich repeat and IQ domain-containing protein 3-like isoform X2 [Stegostoma tigrinum]|uniref:leucine-rich repeat and IQ domain-containing protein 3-like isoform X2 n=1 Tax=Stegostoma tigrinum TaxID=3053191 RepID=UPI002870AEF9|nr:leucine-rich repeat and IQ domain-containing protein 3-like isoform X2 [Stegostoma tigrinum]
MAGINRRSRAAKKHPVNRSHLVSPSKSLTLSCGEMIIAYEEKKLNEIVVVNLSGRYLKNLGSLPHCSALKICNLSRNYITKIDALAGCPNLIKLDLHGNHISHLPDENFWSEMKSLQILFLHGNLIGPLRSVEPLFSCPNLIVLTLFDTPVSLFPKYRHHVVNSILSLKALDHFVISDEEIIEDWPKSEEFKALSPYFFIDLPLCSQVTGSGGKKDGQHNIVQLQIDVNKLDIALLEDRCEANEITSGIYPSIARWNRWNSPNFKSNKSSIFRRRFFRKPDFAPQPETFVLESLTNEEKKREIDKEGKEKAYEDTSGSMKPFRVIHQPDAVREMLLSRLASGADVRQGIQKIHEMLRNKPQRTFTYQPPIGLDMRLYAKTHGSISLAPFMAIQKAYSKREKEMKHQLLIDETRKLKAAEDQSRSNLLLKTLNKSYKPLQQYEQDQLRGEQILLRRNVDEAELLAFIRHNHYLFLTEKRRLESEQQLVTRFNCSYTMLSESELKRQIKEKNENVRQQKINLTQGIKKKANQLKKEIRDFITYQQLTMQAEHSAARKVAQTILSQAAKDRLLHARARVSAQRAQRHSRETAGPITRKESVTRPKELPDISIHFPPTQSAASVSEN